VSIGKVIVPSIVKSFTFSGRGYRHKGCHKGDSHEVEGAHLYV
jgi:hypothetical protein